jgi:hypothetical protein
LAELLSTNHCGGSSVMVWECFENNQVEDFVKNERILLKNGYKRILKSMFGQADGGQLDEVSFSKKIMTQNILFQLDS